MKIFFFVNPRAGSGKGSKIAALLDSLLEGTNIQYTMLPSTQENLDLIDTASLREQEVNRVIAIGGDGTINAVASKLMYSDIPFGVIPLGSGNGLARSLKIPFDYRESIQVIKTGKTITIDAGVINRHHFFATAGVGFDAWVATAYNQQASNKRGMIPYYYHSLKGYFNFKPFKTDLRVTGSKSPPDLFMVTLANTKEFGGGAVISPSADPCDGKLDLCIIKPPSMRKIIDIPRLFTKTIHKSSLVEIRKIESVNFECSIPVPFHADGEPFKPQKDFEVSILPGALQICVPSTII